MLEDLASLFIGQVQQLLEELLDAARELGLSFLIARAHEYSSPVFLM